MSIHKEHGFLYCKTKKNVQECITTGFDINSLIHSGRNALFHNRHTSAVKAMIEEGMSLDHTDHYGNNALFVNSSPEILSLLIDSGINIHHTNDKGENCLSRHKYDRASTETLINAGVDIHHKDNNGQTLLYNNLNNLCFDYLVNKGCDLNHRDNNGNTALDLPGHKSYKYDFIVMALARHLDKIDTPPTLFKHLSIESLPLLALLHKKGIHFTVDQHCTFSLYVREMKEFFVELKSYADIGHVQFYNMDTKHIGSYTGIETVKWLIRNGIRIDDEILIERADADKIFGYIARRDKKELFKMIKSEIIRSPKRKRI
ncbi:ankyrin repeat domain-containing protein [Salmonella enterica]|nr:ankyrin repeat domain-containing protein [Salmonella enterica]EIV7305345.1 ankyrin repeat domain-containing protein [Salmonella enterica subsp. enterica serovar Panama]EBG1336718.1 ankyrin repeat domain-containing protein [Salmonella enterica]EBH0285397.1 ankyrin repeat domain-containing protein [Salmonella enterica]ECD8519303.1 ankyrin repeat domain-containing protein [Salmonella enterica]